MEWKRMKIIILEYSSILLFWSFLMEGMKLVERDIHSSLFPEKQIFILLKLGEMRGNRIRFNDYFLLKLPKYPYIFNPLF